MKMMVWIVKVGMVKGLKVSIPDLDSVALSDEHPLYLIHAFIALASSMANQTTLDTQFMDPFICTLYLGSRTIIHLKHEAYSGIQGSIQTLILINLMFLGV